jgi:uncharacterized protein YkwD
VGHLAKPAAAALLIGCLLLVPSAAGASTPPVAQAAGTATPHRHAARPHRHAARSHRRTAACPARRVAGHRTARSHSACRASHHRRHRTPSTPSGTTAAAGLSATPSTGQSASAAAVAAVLAAPCQNTQLTPEAGNGELVRGAVLCLINQERAQHGIAPLEPNRQLEEAAESHAGELIADDYFAHVSPTGETPVDRIRTTGYIPGPNVGYVIGENLAWGTFGLATPQSIVSAWIASPGHLANILESQYSETGIGIAASVPSSLGDGAPGATYAQEFGAIVH